MTLLHRVCFMPPDTANNRQREALCYGLSLLRRPSVRTLTSISLYLVDGFQWNYGRTYSSCEGKLLERFSRSEVKDQGHSEVKCAERYPSTYGRLVCTISVRRRRTNRRCKYITGFVPGWTGKIDSDISPYLSANFYKGDNSEIWPPFSTIESPVVFSGIERKQLIWNLESTLERQWLFYLLTKFDIGRSLLNSEK